jgi:putative SbcD/Mre11-related phosphoesterase
MDSAEILDGVHVTNERCLILDDGPTAVIGDLHLGYESALEDEGMYIPRMNNNSIRDSLNRILCRYEPRRVVLLGDIKHDFRRAPYECRDEVGTILDMLRDAAEVVIVKGNHDNFIENIISGMGMTAWNNVDIAGFRMEHGHEDSGRRPVIIAHEHPSVRFGGPVGGGVKVQCFVHMKRDGIIVIPPFSPFSSGNDIAGTEFMSPACRSADTGGADIYGISDLGILKMGKLRDLADIEF